MKIFQTGKVLLDIRNLKSYSLEKRSAAVNKLKTLLLDKSPFFVLAVIKGSNFFENSTLQVSLKLSLKLSNKFLDGQFFIDQDSALKWLKEFKIPSNFEPRNVLFN